MHTVRMAPLQADAELPLVVAPSVHRGTDMPFHTHECYEFVYVRRGGGIHQIDERPYPIIAGDFYLMRPGEAHRYVVERGELLIVNVLLRPELFAAADWAALCALPGLAPLVAGDSGERHKLTLTPPHDHAVEALLERIRAELTRRAPGYRLLARALALDLLTTIDRVAAHQLAGPAPGPVAAVVSYLHANAEQEISMVDLAAEAGLTANYLGERFKAELGVSVADYLNRLRVDRARELLAGTDRAITAIASDVGFAGLSYFGKVFRKLTGHTPRAYRAIARGG